MKRIASDCQVHDSHTLYAEVDEKVTQEVHFILRTLLDYPN